MPIPCAVLMCHAPIVVPEVAGERAALCSLTTCAMKEVAARLCEHQPDVLVIVSPHAKRHRSGWGVCVQPTLHGSFRRFGAPQVGLSLPGAPAAAARVSTLASARGLHLEPFSQEELDHGALVPLHFVHQAGFSGPTLLLSPPATHTETQASLGRVIALAAAEAGERWAVLASGDMSHRLQPGAPCGFDPRAAQFDATFRACIERGQLREACATDLRLRALAAEDVVDSVAVAAAAVDYRCDGHRAYAYEGPFGVGYLEAVLFDTATATSQAASHPTLNDSGEPPWPRLLQAARTAIADHLSGASSRPAAAPLPEPWNGHNTAHGVFVTLRDRRGGLRGCVGHIEPQHPSLLDEVASCAVAAATRDSRFRPVELRELAELTIELSLLTPPEPVADLTLLDPKRYGVVVSAAGARGVLLPNVPGITSAEEQVRVAASKARLPDDQPRSVERFEVRKGTETPPLTTTRRGHA